MTRRWAARADTYQTEIVAALRAAGWRVLHLHRLGQGCPDLLAGKRGANVLVEIKTPGEKLTPAVRLFFDEWPGPKIIAFSAQDALDKLHVAA